MRLTKLLPLLVLILLFATLTVNAQFYYMLVCRGGGELYFTYTPFSILSPKPQVWISFDHGNEAVEAGLNNVWSLEPGQCSWLDRGLYADEPTSIAILEPVIADDDFSISWTQGQVLGVSSGLYYINALQNEDYYQAFRVTNNRNGFFIVQEIETTNYTPYAPEIVAPADGAVFNHFPRTTTLEWVSVDNAASYVVEIDCLHCCRTDWWCSEFDQPYQLIDGITNTEYTFEFVGAQPGRWRVWAIYSNGYVGQKSAWQYFNYTR